LLRQPVCQRKASQVVFVNACLPGQEAHILVLFIFLQCLYRQACKRGFQRPCNFFKQRRWLLDLSRNGHIDLCDRRGIEQHR
jgi:hypothetical protein